MTRPYSGNPVTGRSWFGDPPIVLTWKTVRPSVGPAVLRGFLGEVKVASITTSVSSAGSYSAQTIFSDTVCQGSDQAKLKEWCVDYVRGWCARAGLRAV